LLKKTGLMEWYLNELSMFMLPNYMPLYKLLVINEVVEKRFTQLYGYDANHVRF
jgi:hypothetical protein